MTTPREPAAGLRAPPVPALRRALPWLLASSLLAACATVPEYDPTMGRTATVAKPEIIGTAGPLPAAESRALLLRLGGGEPGVGGMLWRHLTIEQAVAETPLIAGNRIQLLRDGPASFQAIFAAIHAARQRIDLEYFIFEDVEFNGEKLGDLLTAKRREGVTVNIIIDSFGTSATPAAFLERLRAAGVTIVAFNPLNPLAAGTNFAPNHRDHRKILLADGRLAIIGGVNLSADYQSHPSRGSSTPPATPKLPWRDTDLRIEGPAVAQVQALFDKHWHDQNGPPLPQAKPPAAEAGHEVMRIIGSTPDHAIPRYYVAMLSAIRMAERSISITAAYFVPTRQAREDLAEAARRGVAVRLLLPDASDSPRAIDVAHSTYAELLDAGVKIHETHGIVLHAKTVVIDGVWSMVGSSNFDQRSVLFNDEVDAVVLGTETAIALERMFDDDLRGAHAINAAEWSRRPLPQKLREQLSRGAESVL